jgi:hypothetical protein
MNGPGMTDDERFDFFISYTGRDEAWATWVAHQLQQAGYRLLIQAWHFEAGSFILDMERAVRQSDRLVPILSNEYLRKYYCRLEWAAYITKNNRNGENDENPRLIIPVQVEAIQDRSLLNSLVRVNLIGLAEHQAKDKLLDIIGNYTSPLYGRPDRIEGDGINFPATAGSTQADVEGTGAIPWPSSPPTLAIDRDRIQLILLGDGQIADEAVASLVAKLDGARQCNLLNSRLTADEQLTQIAELVKILDPEEVSDVLIVFVGRGIRLADADVYLHVQATDPGKPASTAISLKALLEQVQYGKPPRLRSYLILDAVDADGQAVGPLKPTAVPVVKNGPGHQGRRALAAISDALASPPWELTDKISHLGPLCLADLGVLAGGELVASDDSPAHLFGLVPSPLDWPQESSGQLTSWCAVISESDDSKRPEDSVRNTIGRLADYSLNALRSACARFKPAVHLESQPGKLPAGSILSSPGALARAVEQVCRADLAIFDLTNFEPAVMILLGIRAVIRRGLTVCVAGEHDAPWRTAEPPFHLREISLVTPPDPDALQARIQEGFRQLAQPGNDYRDLPCFDLIRAVPQDPQQRRIRAFDAASNPSILALVPFDARYVKHNWKRMRQDLPTAAKDVASRESPRSEETPKPLLQRTLDLDSPRVVSAQLFEAIRLTDFCLVDLTGARPNVLFELGVRLAANRLHPVVIIDPRFYPADDGEADHADNGDGAYTTWLGKMDSQLGMLRQLLQPVEYTPTAPGVFTQMVERHLSFRRSLAELPEATPAEPAGGVLPAGIYDLAWRHAAADDEVVTLPVAERLEAGGDALMISTTEGRKHLIYPKEHPLTEAADRTGLEYLIAAWLYLHFRKQAAGGTDAALTRQYNALTDKLADKLDGTTELSNAAFMKQLLQWNGTTNGERQADETDG